MSSLHFLFRSLMIFFFSNDTYFFFLPLFSELLIVFFLYPHCVLVAKTLLDNVYFSKTTVHVAKILPTLSLPVESNKKNHWSSKIKPKVLLLIINRAPVVICRQSLIISVNDTRSAPALISLVLLLRNYIFIEEYSIKNSFDKSSIPRYLYLLRDLNKGSHFCRIKSKSKESHMLADLNNIQQADITYMHEHCIPLNNPYSISRWR